MIEIKKNLDREAQNSPINEAGILQGNYSNLRFMFTLTDSGELVNISDSANILVSVRPAITNLNYAVSGATVTNNAVVINGVEVMTNYEGPHTLTIQYGNLYTFSTTYNVAYNPAYSPAPITPSDYSKYANKDLSNVTNNNFKQKADAAGIATDANINSNTKYFTDPNSNVASRLRYEPSDKTWHFELKENRNWVEKFKVGESAIVDVLKLVAGEKPSNVPVGELALYNKLIMSEGQQVLRPRFVLPDGKEYGFVVHDEQTDKVVFTANDGTTKEIPISGKGVTGSETKYINTTSLVNIPTNKKRVYYRIDQQNAKNQTFIQDLPDHDDVLGMQLNIEFISGPDNTLVINDSEGHTLFRFDGNTKITLYASNSGWIIFGPREKEVEYIETQTPVDIPSSINMLVYKSQITGDGENMIQILPELSTVEKGSMYFIENIATNYNNKLILQASGTDTVAGAPTLELPGLNSHILLIAGDLDWQNFYLFDATDGKGIKPITGLTIKDNTGTIYNDVETIELLNGKLKVIGETMDGKTAYSFENEIKIAVQDKNNKVEETDYIIFDNASISKDSENKIHIEVDTTNGTAPDNSIIVSDSENNDYTAKKIRFADLNVTQNSPTEVSLNMEFSIQMSEKTFEMRGVENESLVYSLNENYKELPNGTALSFGPLETAPIKNSNAWSNYGVAGEGGFEVLDNGSLQVSSITINNIYAWSTTTAQQPSVLTFKFVKDVGGGQYDDIPGTEFTKVINQGDSNVSVTETLPEFEVAKDDIIILVGKADKNGAARINIPDDVNNIAVSISFQFMPTPINSYDFTKLVKSINLNAEESKNKLIGVEKNITFLNERTLNGGYLGYFSQPFYLHESSSAFRSTKISPTYTVLNTDPYAINPDYLKGTIVLQPEEGEVSTLFLICVQIAFNQKTTTDGILNLMLINEKFNDVMIDIEGKPASFIKNYEVGENLGSISLVTIVSIDTNTYCHVLLKDTLRTQIEVNGLYPEPSAVMVQKITDEQQTGLALMQFEADTRQSIEFAKIKIPNVIVSTASMSGGEGSNEPFVVDSGAKDFSNGWIFNAITELKLNRNSGIVTMQDNNKPAYFVWGYVLNSEMTQLLWNQEVILNITTLTALNECWLQLAIWNGDNDKYTTEIITGVEADNITPVLADDWTLLDDGKTKVNIHKDEIINYNSNNIAIPAGTANIAFVIYPVEKLQPINLQFENMFMSLPGKQTIEKYIISTPLVRDEKREIISQMWGIFKTNINPSLPYLISSTQGNLPVGNFTHGNMEYEYLYLNEPQHEEYKNIPNGIRFKTEGIAEIEYTYNFMGVNLGIGSNPQDVTVKVWAEFAFLNIMFSKADSTEKSITITDQDFAVHQLKFKFEYPVKDGLYIKFAASASNVFSAGLKGAQEVKIFIKHEFSEPLNVYDSYQGLQQEILDLKDKVNALSPKASSSQQPMLKNKKTNSKFFNSDMEV